MALLTFLYVDIATQTTYICKKLFMKVAILVYNNCSLWAATGTMEILLRANKVKEFFSRKKTAQFFEIEFVSASKNPIKTHYKIPISYNSTIFDDRQYDLVIIQGTDVNPILAIEENRSAVEWIKKQFTHGSKIASICTGSFLLAASGILENKTATTHWYMANLFNKTFPDINLCSEKIIVDNGDIFMSGGATSFQNLMIYLIDKFMGHQIALGVSRLYLIDIHKDNQNSYSILNLQKNHNDQSILEAQKYIESNFEKKLSLAEIAEKVSMSKRNFIRRFKSVTGDTPLQYIQKVKVEQAKRILEAEKKSFEEIVYEVGYEDINAFRKLFIRVTGITPSSYKKKYNLSYI